MLPPVVSALGKFLTSSRDIEVPEKKGTTALEMNFLTSAIGKQSMTTCVNFDKYSGQNNIDPSLNKIDSMSEKEHQEFIEEVCNAGKATEKTPEQISTIAKFLKSVHPLANLHRTKLKKVAQNVKFQQLDKGKTLVKKTSRAITAYFLVKGQVGLTPPNISLIFDYLEKAENSFDSDNLYMSTKNPYDMFGYWEVIYNKNRPVSFVCTEPTFLQTLTSDHFKLFVEDTFKRMLYSVMKSINGIIYFDGWHETAIGNFLEFLKLEKCKRGQIIYDVGSIHFFKN